MFFINVLFWPVVVIFAVASYICFQNGSTAGTSGDVMLLSLIALIPMDVMRSIYTKSDVISVLWNRIERMKGKGSESPVNTLVSYAGSSYFTDLMESRDEQRTQAIKEADIPFVDVGKTTGKLFERKSYLSPSEDGLPFRINLTSLSVHCIVTGLTGSGKTSSLLRPIIGSIVSADKSDNVNIKFGMWIADMKLSLQKDVKNVFDGFYADEPKNNPYTLIGPDEGSYFNPFAYLTLTQGADLLTEVAVEASADWKGHAYQLILSSMHSLDVLGIPITLFNLDKACCDKGYFEKLKPHLIKKLEEGNLSKVQNKFVKHRAVLFELYPEKMAGSIVGIVSMAFSNILTDDKIIRMSSAWKEEFTQGKTTYPKSFDVSSCLRGMKAGMVINKERYGVYAAKFFNLAAKQILFNECKIRGEYDWFNKDYGTCDQTPCIMIADEVQSGLLTKAKDDEDQADADMASTGRGYGMWMIYATQTIGGLYKSIGRDATKQLLGNMRNKFFFTTDDEDTLEYIEAEFGSVKRLETEGRVSTADVRTALDQFSRNSEDAFYNRHGEIKNMTGRMNKAPEAEHAAQKLMEDKKQVAEMAAANGDFETYLKITEELNSGLKEKFKPDTVPLIKAAEVQTLLPKKFQCLATVQRAGVQRMDVIQTKPVSNVVEFIEQQSKG